jgi:hypothetical protein
MAVAARKAAQYFAFKVQADFFYAILAKIMGGLAVPDPVSVTAPAPVADSDPLAVPDPALVADPVIDPAPVTVAAPTL